MDDVSASESASILIPWCRSWPCSKREDTHAEPTSNGPHLACGSTGGSPKIVRLFGGLGPRWAPGRSTLGGHFLLPQQGRRPDQAAAVGGGRVFDLVQATGARTLPFPGSKRRQPARRDPHRGP